MNEDIYLVGFMPNTFVCCSTFRLCTILKKLVMKLGSLCPLENEHVGVKYSWNYAIVIVMP
jgi:hypothetical protein